jgi:U3 small nucleolar RNA-associated protein 15
MAQFQKLQLKSYAKLQDRETSEAKYWKSFTTTSEDKIGSPNCIHFNPANSRYFIVSASTKIYMYDTIADKIQKSFSQFSDECFSAQFRRDGKLIVAGDKTGNVKIFDVQTKSILRLLKGHKDAVRTTVWNSTGHHVISGSDDRSIKVWDLATQDILWNCTSAHEDYVRCSASSPISPDVFATGSYDHTVKLWDYRQKSTISTFTHGHPVESCFINTSSTMLISAGGNNVKIWDLMQSRLLHTFSSHQKNITSVCMDGTNTRLISCGLDGNIKFYNISTLQNTYGLKIGVPLTAISTNPNDNTKLIIGTSEGNLITRTRQGKSNGSLGRNSTDEDINEEEHQDSQQQLNGRGGNDVSKNVQVSNNVVETEKTKTRLRPYEVMLKKFNYQQALDAALKTRNPLVVVAVLEELSRRSGLTIALSGRDEVTLEPILAFIARYITQPRFTRLIIQVAHRILDLYSSILGHSDVIDEIFLKLKNNIKSEMVFHRSIMSVMGSLEGIISNSEINQSSVDASSRSK